MSLHSYIVPRSSVESSDKLAMQPLQQTPAKALTPAVPADQMR